MPDGDPREGPATGHEKEEKNEKRFRYFITMLDMDDPSRCWKAIEALARMGDSRAVDPVIRALADEDWRVRQKAAWALGVLGDQRAIPALRKAYRGELEGIQEMITEAIEMIMAQARGEESLDRGE
jgi:HEAT repeat protein